jgi:hypothetical protein
MNNGKQDFVERLKELKSREASFKADDKKSPVLNTIEQKVKVLVDAATMVSIFKNESIDETAVMVPKKAMDELDRAIQMFSPKIWEQIQQERAAYLSFLGMGEKVPDTKKVHAAKGIFKMFGFKGSDK